MLYNGLSEIYDRLMSDVDYDSWCYFIKNKCSIDNTSSVVDAACGTGNVSLRLAQIGARVVGIDNSSDMLQIASTKARERGLNIAFATMDISNMKLHKQVDVICCVCDGVNYLPGINNLESFFNSAYTILKDHGKLIFDISSEYKLKNILGDNLFFEDYDDLTYFWQNQLGNGEEYIDMDLCFFIKNGSTYQRFDEQHRQYIYTEKQIIELLKKCGFNNVCTYDNYNDQPVNDKTQRITFLAEK